MACSAVLGRRRVAPAAGCCGPTWHLILQSHGRVGAGVSWTMRTTSPCFQARAFVSLLDNAHNLPLHLAVELGLPFGAVGVRAGAVVGVARTPWAETDPVRQLAWGILAVVGLHSMLEFPLWYGPFQLVTLWALGAAMARTWAGCSRASAVRRVPLGLWAVVALAGLVLWGRWGGITTASAKSPPGGAAHASIARQPSAGAGRRLGVQDAIAIAELTTTMPINRRTCRAGFALALRMLHYSPGPG